MISAVMDVMEATRVTLDPGVLPSYAPQGLPKCKVREVYWRFYNALHFGAADALVPFYRDLGELTDEKNVFDRDSPPAADLSHLVPSPLHFCYLFFHRCMYNSVSRIYFSLAAEIMLRLQSDGR